MGECGERERGRGGREERARGIISTNSRSTAERRFTCIITMDFDVFT